MNEYEPNKIIFPYVLPFGAIVPYMNPMWQYISTWASYILQCDPIGMTCETHMAIFTHVLNMSYPVVPYIHNKYEPWLTILNISIWASYVLDMVPSVEHMKSKWEYSKCPVYDIADEGVLNQHFCLLHAKNLKSNSLQAK